MKYNQIGFANVKLPNYDSTIYEYSSTNTFPEEVFIHEFLHTLERNEKNNGNDIANLHDYAQYGYQNDDRSGLKEWYRDYMQNNIKNATNKGLTDFAYNSKPIQESNFEYSIFLDNFDEPQNIIERIRSIFSKIGSIFSK